ncbi:MAG: helix-turn-helix transcriptional regulator, partial [Deltaproteobacteria bacterium]|nr:helix-turn-helix transcriptional regulator [Deltaproteobacteria bacterium]
MKVNSHRRENGAVLTPREKKVLELVGEANTNKEIAAALGISPATVKRHIENILRKLSLKNRIEAALYAVGAGSCPLPIRPADCPL